MNKEAREKWKNLSKRIFKKTENQIIVTVKVWKDQDMSISKVLNAQTHVTPVNTYGTFITIFKE